MAVKKEKDADMDKGQHESPRAAVPARRSLRSRANRVQYVDAVNEETFEAEIMVTHKPEDFPGYEASWADDDGDGDDGDDGDDDADVMEVDGADYGRGSGGDNDSDDDGSGGAGGGGQGSRGRGSRACSGGEFGDELAGVLEESDVDAGHGARALVPPYVNTLLLGSFAYLGNRCIGKIKGFASADFSVVELKQQNSGKVQRMPTFEAIRAVAQLDVMLKRVTDGVSNSVMNLAGHLMMNHNEELRARFKVSAEKANFYNDRAGVILRSIRKGHWAPPEIDIQDKLTVPEIQKILQHASGARLDKEQLDAWGVRIVSRPGPTTYTIPRPRWPELPSLSARSMAAAGRDGPRGGHTATSRRNHRVGGGSRAGRVGRRGRGARVGRGAAGRTAAAGQDELSAGEASAGALAMSDIADAAVPRDSEAADRLIQNDKAFCASLVALAVQLLLVELDSRGVPLTRECLARLVDDLGIHAELRPRLESAEDRWDLEAELLLRVRARNEKAYRRMRLRRPRWFEDEGNVRWWFRKWHSLAMKLGLADAASPTAMDWLDKGRVLMLHHLPLPAHGGSSLSLLVLRAISKPLVLPLAILPADVAFSNADAAKMASVLSSAVPAWRQGASVHDKLAGASVVATPGGTLTSALLEAWVSAAASASQASDIANDAAKRVMVIVDWRCGAPTPKSIEALEQRGITLVVAPLSKWDKEAGINDFAAALEHALPPRPPSPQQHSSQAGAGAAAAITAAMSALAETLSARAYKVPCLTQPRLSSWAPGSAHGKDTDSA